MSEWLCERRRRRRGTRREGEALGEQKLVWHLKSRGDVQGRRTRQAGEGGYHLRKYEPDRCLGEGVEGGEGRVAGWMLSGCRNLPDPPVWLLTVTGSSPPAPPTLWLNDSCGARAVRGCNGRAAPLMSLFLSVIPLKVIQRQALVRRQALFSFAKLFLVL